MWYNKDNEYCWVKYHFKTNQKIENLTSEEADFLSGKDPDSFVKDLFNSIEKGDFPSWNAYVQIMTKEQAKNYRFDPFDVTKVWYHKDFPLIPLGKMVLNQNPTNFFTDIEQAAFSPSHFVKGIGPSPDKLLQGRLMAYPDAHRHRIGANVNELQVNMPRSLTYTYQKDGDMANVSQGNTKLNYFPNTYEDITTDESYKVPNYEVDGFVSRHVFPSGPIDFEQPRELYQRVMSEDKKEILVTNLANSLKLADLKLQYRTCALFFKISDDLGNRVCIKLSINPETAKNLSLMTQEELVTNTQ